MCWETSLAADAAGRWPARQVFVRPPRSVHSTPEAGSLAPEPLNSASRPSDGSGVRPRPPERAVELVFPEEQAIQLLRAAEEQDVAAGGVFSAGPAGVQVWSEPWNGDGGTSGSSVQLGSVEWTANAPTRAYITIHRCRVTRAGRARGVEPADLLKRASSSWPACTATPPGPTWPWPIRSSPPNRARRWYPRVVPIPVWRFAQW